ncbi:MAG: hypothetical protein V1928_03235 [Parcubacteria group bacterium]
MGFNTYTVKEYGFEIVSHVKRIKGKCPMCGTEFDLSKGESDYDCPCGYFHFDAESESLNEDNHNIPQEAWLRKLKENLEKK